MKKLTVFDETSKFIFVSTIVVMILAHGFCFANLMYSHDSLGFFNTEGLGKVGLGRWLYPTLVQRRFIATPWLMGVLSILYVSTAVVLVTKLFDFSKIQGLCVSILFGTNITLTTPFCTYIFDADADCLALLLACFAVYAFKFFPRYFNIITPIILIALCLALYQAYICVAIGLYIVLLIYESRNIISWKKVLLIFALGLKELFTLVSGTALYVLLMHAASNYYNVELSTDYNGAGKLSSLTLTSIIENIPKAYECFMNFFFQTTELNTASIVSVNLLIFLCLLLLIVLFIISHRNYLGSLLIIIPSIIIVPLALNSIYCVSFGVFHQLMIFAFCITYLLPFVFINLHNEYDFEENSMNKYITRIKVCVNIVCIFSVLVIGINNIVYANGAYVYKKLVYDNTRLHAQTIWVDINSIDGYIEGETPVVFIGDFTSSKAAYRSSVANRYNQVLEGADSSSITYAQTIKTFYYGILGRNINILYNDPTAFANSESDDMPAYPTEGYCKMIGDTVVIKMCN